MRNLIVILSVAAALVGCMPRKAMVDLYTDGNGRVSRVVVTKSTGDRAADDKVKQAAIDSLHRQRPKPAKNTVYHQPANVYFPPEPMVP